MIDAHDFSNIRAPGHNLLSKYIFKLPHYTDERPIIDMSKQTILVTLLASHLSQPYTNANKVSP